MDEDLTDRAEKHGLSYSDPNGRTKQSLSWAIRSEAIKFGFDWDNIKKQISEFASKYRFEYTSDKVCTAK